MRCVLTICLVLIFAASLRAAPSLPNVTTYPQMMAQLKVEARISPLVRVVSLGKSAGGHREIWLVRLADPTADLGKTMRLLVLCRQHGDEPASTEALLRLIHGVSSGGDPSLRSELSRVSLYVIPMANPDGSAAGTRVNSKGADLNRDWGLFRQPETQAVARAATLIHPALIVDAHNWDGSDEYNADCIEVPREMETRQGRAVHAMQQQVIHDLAASGYAVHPTAWGEDSDPHLAHRWFTHQNITSLLVETHYGSPADRADFERREGMYTALVHSLVRHDAAPWTRQVSSAAAEASLFPPPAPPPAARHLAFVPKILPQWLWAFGLYGLALWGITLRQPEPQTLPRGKRHKSQSLLRLVLRTKQCHISLFASPKERFSWSEWDLSPRGTASRRLGRYSCSPPWDKSKVIPRFGQRKNSGQSGSRGTSAAPANRRRAEVS